MNNYNWIRECYRMYKTQRTLRRFNQCTSEEQKKHTVQRLSKREIEELSKHIDVNKYVLQNI